jgi:3-hydroxyisobutyrate dehydrogenase
MKPTVALVGLGRMGAPMARRLLAARYRLRVYDASPRARAAFAREKGATVCASPADAARSARVLITMLPDGAAVRAALLGRDGAANMLARGAVVLDMSSSDPKTTRRLGRALAARGAAFLDAPVSGRVVGARDGTLTIMVGGSAAALTRVRPVLKHLGTRIYHCGPAGAGHAVKSLSNAIAAAGTVAAFEALLVGRALGLDAKLINEVWNASAGRNTTTEQKIPTQVLTRAFASGFALSLMAKDLGIAAGLARKTGVDAPLMRRSLALWRAAERRLAPGADHTEMYLYLKNVSAMRKPRRVS